MTLKEIKHLLRQIKFGDELHNEVLRLAKPRYIGAYINLKYEESSLLFFVYEGRLYSLPARESITDEHYNIIGYRLYIPKIEGCIIRKFETITEASYFARYGREIWDDVKYKITITDFSDYDPSMSCNGGKYLYWKDYYYIPNINGWLRVVGNSSEFHHCKICGRPKDFGATCCEDYRVFSTSEVISEVLKAKKDEDKEVKIFFKG